MRTRAYVDEADRSDAGAVAVVVAAAIVVLMGVTALVVDLGGLYAQRRQLQTAADAAALAGAQRLPGSRSLAEARAVEYVTPNATGSPDVSVDFPADYAIHVVVDDPDFELFFARFVDVDSKDVRVEATARLSSPSGYGSRVVPMGVPPEGVAPPPNHQPITLKFEPGNDFGPGKFGWTALTEDGINPGEIKNALAGGGVGYDVELGPVADRPGYNPDKPVENLAKRLEKDECSGAGLTADDHFLTVCTPNADGSVTINDFSCIRLVVCPVVEGLNGHKNLRIIGFAWFFIDTASDKTITGRFLRPVNPENPTGWGEYDPYGAIGKPKLIE